MKDLCHVIHHPLLMHKITHLRHKDTQPAEFRNLMEEISSLLAFETTRDLKLQKINLETPMEKCEGHTVGEDLILVSVLRAGNGMVEGMLKMLPFAKVGHIGMYRDKAIHAIVEYFFKLPKDVKGKTVLVLDPLLATGDTAVAAIDRLKESGVGKIKFVSILAAPVGVKKLKETHPDVEIYTASMERELNSHGYILPGLGDAGDRVFGTL